MEVVPDEPPPGLLTRVAQQGCRGYRHGRIRGCQRGVLADLAVGGARVDAVDHDVSSA